MRQKQIWIEVAEAIHTAMITNDNAYIRQGVAIAAHEIADALVMRKHRFNRVQFLVECGVPVDGGPVSRAVSRCSVCGEPAHASDTDDLDRCAKCRTRMITADTITDAQIREMLTDRNLLTACIASIAVGEMDPRVQRLTFAQTLEMNRCAGRDRARARCAEILNARNT